MLAYWLLFGFFAIGALFARIDPRPDKRFGALVIGGLILTLMIGLRWRVGADWGPYQNWWHVAGAKAYGRFLQVTGADPGFYSLMWGLAQTGVSVWVLNLIVAAIFVTGLVAFARTMPNPWLAIAVAVPYLVIVVAMSGIRQATAIGFVLLALIAFERRQGKKFFAWLALAASFHASAILVVPLAGLSFTRNRLQAALLIALLALGAYYSLSHTFVRYSDRYMTLGALQSTGTLFRIAMSILPAILYFTLKDRFPGQPHERSLWRNFSIAAIASLPVYFLVESTTALDRLLLYLFPLQIYVLSWFPAFAKDQGIRFLMNIAILVYLALQLFLFLNYGLNKDAYLPYEWIPFTE